MDICNRLKTLREENSLTMLNMSKRLNWSVSKLSKIESGSQKVTVDEISDITRVLGIETYKLFQAERTDFYFGLEKANEVKNLIYRAAVEYSEERNKKFGGNPIGKLYRSELPQALIRNVLIDSEEYLVEGSVGKGQFSEIPWIAIFKRDITNTATKGIYIVLLFKKDMSGVYLSLNQGFTYFNQIFKGKERFKKIKQVANYIRHACKTITSDVSLEEIYLGSMRDLGIGYEHGHITGKYYDINNLPESNKIIHDIRKLMTVYEEVVGIIGNRSVDEFYEYILAILDGAILSDNEMHKVLEESLCDSESEGKKLFQGIPKRKKKPVRDGDGRYKYPRDKQVERNALILGNHKCAFDETHGSFIRRIDNTNYTEPHHIIPISKYEDFEYSLDVEENIAGLCSKCHDCVHYGKNDDRIKILERLYLERKELLDKAGIGISFEKLKEYYGIR